MNQDNPQAIIQVRDLCNRFGAQVVHEHLDLDVRRGEILGVVGGSGTGKSVLLRSIVGLRRPTSGSVRVFGEDLLQLPEERRSWSNGASACCSSRARCFPRLPWWRTSPCR